MQKKTNYRKNKRQYYRIEYPISCRPKIIFLEEEYEVINISEYGLKFTCKEAHILKPGSKATAKIVFKDGGSAIVKGEILRVDEHDVIFNLSKGISLKRVIDEQRYIIENYPDRQ